MRRDERFSTNLLTTNLGAVADISASGVRVRSESRPSLVPGDVVPLTVRSPQCKVVVHSRVIRIRRTRARGVEVSLAFLDAKPALRAAITHLGRFGFVPSFGLSESDIASRRPSQPAAAAQPRTRKGQQVVPDYYGLLGITPTASQDEIRRAYHTMAREHHPDASGATDSVGVFEAVSQAYKTLRDENSRRAYDAALGVGGRSAA